MTNTNKKLNNQELREETRNYNKVDAFLDAPIAPALEKIGAGDALEKLNKLLSDRKVNIRSYRNSFEKVAFGDLAVLIEELEVGDERDIIKQAEDIYFTCFEYASKINCEESNAIYSFLHMPFSACFRYAENCDITKESRESYEAYLAEHKDADKATPLTVYNTIKSNGDLEKHKKLVNLLVSPFAMIMALPF